MTLKLITSFDKRALVQSNLERMKLLKDEIKVLQAEFDMLQEQVIESYFNDHEEFKTERGLVLATYKQVTSNVFDSSSFSKDHPDVYSMYKRDRVSYRFQLK